MSFENFPIREKLATDLDSQIAWLVREMGYSRDKTAGYEEKIARLGRGIQDPTSVFGFMSGYWQRFNISNQALDQSGDPELVNRTLQAYAKVVAGVCDKVALSIWLGGENKDNAEFLVDTALVKIKQQVYLLNDGVSDEELLGYIGKPFEENPMGQAIVGLHSSFTGGSPNPKELEAIAIHGSGFGILMWQAYARYLENQGFSSEMPKPGLSSGNIEKW